METQNVPDSRGDIEDISEIWVPCPRCGKEIDHLDAYCYETNRYEVGLGIENKTLDWSTSEVIESSETKRDYECPLCKAILFKTDNPPMLENDVIVPFLKGEEGSWREALYEEPAPDGR